MYNEIKVLDVHGHVSMPQSAMGWITMLLGSNTALPNPLEAQDGIRNPAQVFTTAEEYAAAVDRHVNYIDAREIDVQLIGPRPFVMLGWMEPHLLPVATRYMNDIIHQQCTLYPERFVGACQLPQIASAADTSHCVEELLRCVNELGFGAAYLSPDPEGRRSSPGLHEPYWFPIYETCESLDVPIVIHGSNCLDRRFRHIPHNYQLGFVIEQYIATQVLSHSDVFDRYPALRIVVCHCGGALDRFIPTDPHLGQRDLANNLFFDTCAHDVNYLEAAIKQRTPDRMVFGSEAPGSGGSIRPDTGRSADDLVPVISGFEFLSEEQKLNILHANPARVVPALAAR
jgi:predicted TIM-barrel fold metal-dependent hydrolase